jgi:hypothetical protein
MSDYVIKDLPTGWRGVVHDLGVSLGLAQPTPGERAAEQRHTYCQGCMEVDNSKEAGE